MAKIIEKIKSRPLFFIYIFLTEISYMIILMDFWFSFSIDFYKPAIQQFTISILVLMLLLTH